jgi:hypothetical protein
MTYRLPILSLLTAALCGACSTTSQDVTGPVPQAVRAATDTATVGGQRVRLRAALWRTWAPGPVADSQSVLQGTAEVATTDGSFLRGDVYADSAWVTLGDHAWRITSIVLQKLVADGVLTLDLRDGPTHTSDVVADLVVRVRVDWMEDQFHTASPFRLVILPRMHRDASNDGDVQRVIRHVPHPPFRDPENRVAEANPAVDEGRLAHDHDAAKDVEWRQQCGGDCPGGRDRTGCRHCEERSA